jgi:AcrR family transcriptional regulator
MRKASKPVISPRKRPRQARSTQLVEDIVEAAVRVLTRHGARRFTTVRVAEEAGVSVGSLYQYFPSKEALLYRLQTDEWAETSLVLEEIVSDTSRPPLDRLRRLVLVFFRSERQEAALRVALDDAGALFRDAPEARALFARVSERFARFLEEALPGVPPAKRSLAADVIVMSMSAAAEKITAQSRSRAEVDAWAHEAADMYCGYLERLGEAERGRARRAREGRSAPSS